MGGREGSRGREHYDERRKEDYEKKGWEKGKLHLSFIYLLFLYTHQIKQLKRVKYDKIFSITHLRFLGPFLSFPLVSHSDCMLIIFHFL